MPNLKSTVVISVVTLLLLSATGTAVKAALIAFFGPNKLHNYPDQCSICKLGGAGTQRGTTPLGTANLQRAPLQNTCNQ